MNKDFQILLELFQELTYINDVSDSIKALIRSVWQDFPTQIDKNGFFGQIQGPFESNQNLMLLIKQQCNAKQGNDDNIYISKLGIYYPTFSENTNIPIVSINEKDFAIGKSGVLELEDVQITSLKTLQNVNNTFFIDYQYQKINI